MMDNRFCAGAAEIDITPMVGGPITGAIPPRLSQGIRDPLFIKIAAFKSGNEQLLIAGLDLALLKRDIGDRCIAIASERTGIPESHIIWSVSHSHNTPLTCPILPPSDGPESIDQAWLDRLPEHFATCAVKAMETLEPVRMSHSRSYCINVSHNRRLRYKDGREISTWLLNMGEEELQCIGAAGPIDPELHLIGFDGDDGTLRCVIASFALHANSNSRENVISADYPAAIAAHIRNRFGPQAISIFLPGMCGDLNAVLQGAETGEALGTVAVQALEKRMPVNGPITIGAIKREVTVRFRDLDVPQDERIRRSQWEPDTQELFRKNLELMRQRGITEARTWLSACRIGDICFAGMPGEAFVEYGMRLKQHSPFGWTVPLELCCDWQGYLVTRQAWEAGGYESLISDVAFISVESIEMMEHQLLEMLSELRRNP